MMHGSDYAGQSVRNWTVTEKFDGFFARWTGARLLSRSGENFNAPRWFTDSLPPMAVLDCELFAGYGRRTFLNGCHRWGDSGKWSYVRLMVFDSPVLFGNYASRNTFLHHAVIKNGYIKVVPFWTIAGRAGLIKSLSDITHKGGEGLVIRHPDAPYTTARVQTMLKVFPRCFEKGI